MTEKQSWNPQLNVSDGGSDRRQREAAGSAESVSTDHRVRWQQHPGTASGRESDGKQRPRVTVVENPDGTTSGSTIDVKSVDIFVDVDVDNLRNLAKTRTDSTRLFTSAPLTASTQYSLEPGFYTQNFCCVVELPPQGGRKLFLSETCKNAIKN